MNSLIGSFEGLPTILVKVSLMNATSIVLVDWTPHCPFGWTLGFLGAVQFQVRFFVFVVVYFREVCSCIFFFFFVINDMVLYALPYLFWTNSGNKYMMYSSLSIQSIFRCDDDLGPTKTSNGLNWIDRTTIDVPAIIFKFFVWNLSHILLSHYISITVPSLKQSLLLVSISISISISVSVSDPNWYW